MDEVIAVVAFDIIMSGARHGRAPPAHGRAGAPRRLRGPTTARPPVLFPLRSMSLVVGRRAFVAPSCQPWLARGVIIRLAGLTIDHMVPIVEVSMVVHRRLCMGRPAPPAWMRCRPVGALLLQRRAVVVG